jgi:hypothetical protein
MIGGSGLKEIGLLSLPKIELDVFKERGLVPFYGEVIMSLTLEQVFSQVALG